MQIVWFGLLLIVCLWMIVADLRGRHLDNRLVLAFTALAILAPLVPGLETDEASSVPVALGVGLLAFCAGMVFYGFGLVGGGDAKLVFGIVALETWLGSTAWLVYLGLAIVVGALTLGWHLRSSGWSVGRTTDGDARADGHGIPLAPTLLAGVGVSALLTFGT